MKKIYAIFEGQRILRMGKNKAELIAYRESFPERERTKLLLASKIIVGPKEYQQGHWVFEIKEPATAVGDSRPVEKNS